MSPAIEQRATSLMDFHLDAASQPLPDDIAELPSRILNDVFHTMLNLAASRAHSMARVYQSKRRDAFFIVDESDKANVTRALAA